MKISKYVLAAGALVASMAASAGAQVVGSLGTNSLLPFLGLTQTPGGTGTCGTCTVGSYTLTGGSILNTDNSFSDNESFAVNGGASGGRYLSAGATPGQPATISFTGAVNYVSFLWGSPDTYNRLTVTTNTGGSQVFTVGPVGGATNLGFSTTNGSQAFSQYVQFQAQGSSIITSISFTNDPSTNAFEAANFRVNVPEPANFALLTAGVAALAMMAQRRKRA